MRKMSNYELFFQNTYIRKSSNLLYLNKKKGGNNMLPFYESGNNFEETATIGSFMNANAANSFDNIYEETYKQFTDGGINVRTDITNMIKNPAVMESFKDALLSGIVQECAERAAEGDHWGSYTNLGNQISQLFDNCTTDLIKESTSVGQLLPIKAIDYPVLIKQQVALATKDIMPTEVSKEPIIKKQLEHRWIVDPQSGKRWEYPQCFFDKEAVDEIYKAGKGMAIKATPVTLPIFNFDVIDQLTDATDASRETFTTNLKVVKAILEDGTEIPVDMYINLNTSTWVNGAINRKVKNAAHQEIEVKDQLSGTVDFVGKTVSISSASGQVKQVVFGGYLSNQLNENSVRVEYTREQREWKIEDGHRIDVPYSIEELEDAKALLNMDLYKKTYDDLSRYLVDMEDSKVIGYLDEMYDKYKGIELDPLGFNSFIRTTEFNCDSTIATVALPSEYIEKQLKFLIDRFVIDLTDTAKIEDMTFVIYGNPRYISLLGDNVKWVISNGSMTGGIKHNYSYGIMNTGNVKIQVVSALKFDAKDETKHRGLRVIPIPVNPEQLTFKHYKYTTHILTSQNSGYKAADRPGGSMNYIVGTSRYTDVSIQGIQGYVTFENDNFIFSNTVSA